MANIFEFNGYKPVIHKSAFIHPNATVTGNVIIGKDGSWTARGYPTDAHDVYSKAHTIIDTTRMEGKPYQQLAKKMHISLIFSKELFRSGETIFINTCLGSFFDSVCGVSIFGITFGHSGILNCFINENVNGFSTFT